MPDDSRDEFLPENEREGCKKLSHYLRTYVSSRQQSLTVALVIISCCVSIAASRIKQKQRYKGNFPFDYNKPIHM